MKKYYSRIADSVLKKKLDACGAVIIKGPKWCGKSTTALQVAKSAIFMQDISSARQNIELAKNAPDLFLAGEVPKLIDEWQTIPFIWDQVRFEVDQREENGQFILTGSATPLTGDNGQPYQHSGIGRIVPMVMRPMSLFESKDSSGAVSLSKLFCEDEIPASECRLELQDYAYLTCRGGWPRCIEVKQDVKLEQAKNYFEGLINEDINQVYVNTKNPERFRHLMRSYSRAIASEMSINEIKKDMEELEGVGFDVSTISSYLNALTRLFVVEEMSAWNPNLRSKTAIRSTPTRHFVDPSIACASLSLGPGDLIGDLKTFGLLFESLVVRDLRVFADKLGGTVFHYRDKNGLEADAVIHLSNGNWGAIEVKLSSQEAIEEGAKHLLELAGKIDDSKMKKPSFLMIVTATKYAYKRSDGVIVAPLGCLRD